MSPGRLAAALPVLLVAFAGAAPACAARVSAGDPVGTVGPSGHRSAIATPARRAAPRAAAGPAVPRVNAGWLAGCIGLLAAGSLLGLSATRAVRGTGRDWRPAARQ
jgi:hypothetical protein